MANQDTLKELTSAQVTASASHKFLPDGLADSGVTMADMRRGYQNESLSDSGRVDADGTNYVGDPYSRDGFAGINSKYKRL